MAFITLTPLEAFIFLASQRPHYFPGNLSPFGLTKCHLSRSPLLTKIFVWSRSCMAMAGLLHLCGQQ